VHVTEAQGAQALRSTGVYVRPDGLRRSAINAKLRLERPLVGQRHFGLDLREYEHAARASVFELNILTRLRFVLVGTTKVALSN
jgi:hypothetical protein